MSLRQIFVALVRHRREQGQGMNGQHTRTQEIAR
jgi:hypothetical protein